MGIETKRTKRVTNNRIEKTTTKEQNEENSIEKENSIKAILFVPYTTRSRLAKELREKEKNFGASNRLQIANS